MAQNRVSFFLCFCHLTSSHNPILKGMLIKNAAKPKPDDLSHQICCVRGGTGWRRKGFLTSFSRGSRFLLQREGLRNTGETTQTQVLPKWSRTEQPAP